MIKKLTPYEIALRTLFDHAADLFYAATETETDADAATDVEEVLKLTSQAQSLRIATRAVEEAIRRVMREEITRREPGWPLSKRVAAVNHHFGLSMQAARIRRAPVIEPEEAVSARS